MKHILITTIAAVLVVGCGGSPKDILEAGESGNIEAIKQHLADGADVNAKNNVGQTLCMRRLVGVTTRKSPHY